MSCIGKNIKKIRTVKKINQTDFADLFGLARASVGSYEEGRAEPKIDTIISIANHFGISIDLLLKKELTINELFRFDIFKPELHQSIVAEPFVPLTQAVAGIPLVSAADVGEYILRKGDPTYTAQLVQIHMPFLSKGEYRAFEILEGYGRLALGDVAVGRRVAKKAKPEKGLWYIVLTPTKLFVKHTAESQTIDEEIMEQWEITHTIAAFNPKPEDIETRVARLERLVEELRG